MNGKRAILMTGLLLVLTLAAFESTSLGRLVQDRVSDSTGDWCIDRNAPLPKMIFYDGPKVAIGVIGAFLFLCVAVPASKSAKLPFSRREAAFLLVCIGLIPLTAGRIVGMYQMLKGAHDLSHTVVTMIVA